MIFELGEQLTLTDQEQWMTERRPAVFLSDSKHAWDTLALANLVYEGELTLSRIGYCKLETQQECIAGAFYIPKHVDVLGSRYRVLFFVGQQNIVIVDDEDFSQRQINMIRTKMANSGDTKERFLFNFISGFMNRDLELLVEYERELMDLEERVTEGQITGFQSRLMPVRRKLLTFRGYYDELMDLSNALRENENQFFEKRGLNYFGILADRADRLLSKCVYLLEYAQQIRDVYQVQNDTKQNQNMQFLTLISTIFFPLTLITGWYGMNFKNMPELERGYPFVIGLSLAVVAVCIVVFKKKDLL